MCIIAPAIDISISGETAGMAVASGNINKFDLGDTGNSGITVVAPALHNAVINGTRVFLAHIKAHPFWHLDSLRAVRVHLAQPNNERQQCKAPLVLRPHELLSKTSISTQLMMGCPKTSGSVARESVTLLLAQHSACPLL